MKKENVSQTVEELGVCNLYDDHEGDCKDLTEDLGRLLDIESNFKAISELLNIRKIYYPLKVQKELKLKKLLRGEQ